VISKAISPMDRNPELDMTETPRDREPSPGPDPVDLLIRALAALPEQERDMVYAWLLRRGTSPGVGITDVALRAALRHDPASLPAAFLQPPVLSSVRATIASGQQMVPVRFSSEQHAQLREWCSEHGFSMATVIRGLVARFLEGQPPGTAQGA
jgi:hypothetical protein